MSSITTPSPISATIARWTARVLSLGTLAIIAAFAFGEGTPRPEEWVLLAFFPIGLMVGLVLAWWREIGGGLVALGSMAAFYLICALSRGAIPSGPYFAILASPAVLFVLAGVLRRAGRGAALAA